MNRTVEALSKMSLGTGGCGAGYHRNPSDMMERDVSPESAQALSGQPYEYVD